MRANRALQENIARLEVVVFDIDGVLIDTANSYPQAICNAIRHYQNLKKLSIEDVTYEEVIQFKKFPGFNNDWDITEGLLLYKVAKHAGLVGNLTNFLEEAGKEGDGVKGIRALLSRIKGFNDKWPDRKLVRQLAMEHYAGRKYCSRLYGFKPRYFFYDGTIENEKVILDKTLWEQLPEKKAILTGRNRNETMLALSRLGINGSVACVVYDGKAGYRKPSPELLKVILEETNSTYLVFAGDSYDDYLTASNFSQKYGLKQVHFVQILRKGTNPFKEEISFAENVNDFISYLIEQRGRTK